MTEKGCDNCYYTYFDEKAYPCSLCIRGIERTDMWQPSKKTKADLKDEPQLKGSKRLLKGKTEPQTEETEIERLERIDNEIEGAWTRIRELTDEPQTELCRDCKDYAGNGMFCAKNYMVYDFSRNVCKTEPQERSE